MPRPDEPTGDRPQPHTGDQPHTGARSATDVDPSRPTELTARSLQGVKWTYLATMLSAVLQIVFAAVMGRLLWPEVFGLIAMTQLVLNFGEYFARMGVGPALVQKLHVTNEDIRAGFTSSLILGSLTSTAVWFAAPLAAAVFDEPGVVDILRVMGLALLLSAVGQTAESVLERQLRFREISLLTMAAYVVGYFAVGLVLAALGAGVWSLVFAALAHRGLQSLLFYLRVRHSLRPIFDGAVYRPLFAFGSRVSIISFMEYIGISLDTFMVGRYAGVGPLGQYNRGNTLIQVPLYRLTDALGQVLYPTFSQIQNDLPRLRRAYISAVGLAAGFLLPLCAGIAAAAPEIVLVILGDQWTPVITILPILAVYGSLLALTHFAGVVAEIRNELNTKIVLQAAYLLVLPLLLLPTIGRDLWAYASAFAAAYLLQHIAYMWFMNHILGVRLRDYRRVYGRSIVAAAGVGLAIHGVRLALLSVGVPLVLVLVAEMLVGAVGLLLFFRFGTLRPLGLDVVDRLGDEGGLMGRAARLLVGGADAGPDPRHANHGSDQDAR